MSSKNQGEGCLHKPISFFYGEEDFLIAEKVKALKEKSGSLSLNIEELEGENLSLESFSSALQTTSLFGGDKMVIVRDFEVAAENQEPIINLLKNISPGIKVVLLAESLDRRSKFYKWISEAGEVVEFKSFAPWETDELQRWIAAYVEKNGKKINSGASRQLHEICGSSLRLLAKELDKLITFIGEQKEIREEDVLALASPGERSVFALVDALRDKDLKSALSILQALLRNREDLFRLLALLSSQYRLMLQIKSAQSVERDPWKIAKIVGGSPYAVKKGMEKTHKFTLEELRKNMHLLLDANLRMKTGESQIMVFELLLASLCGA